MTDTYQCPYPGCEWETERPVDSENGLTRTVVTHEIEAHRKEHRDERG